MKEVKKKLAILEREIPKRLINGKIDKMLQQKRSNYEPRQKQNQTYSTVDMVITMYELDAKTRAAEGTLQDKVWSKFNVQTLVLFVTLLAWNAMIFRWIKHQKVPQTWWPTKQIFLLKPHFRFYLNQLMPELFSVLSSLLLGELFGCLHVILSSLGRPEKRNVTFYTSPLHFR